MLVPVGRIIQHWATSRIHPTAFSAIISFRPSLVLVPVGHQLDQLESSNIGPPAGSIPQLLVPSPAPPLSSASSPLAPLLATAGRTAARLLMWPAATVYTVHCTLYLCCVWAQYSPPPPPLVPLGQDGADLQPAASFTVTHQGSARSGTAHKCRLALCLKQGFGEGHGRTFPRDFLVVFLRK